MNELYRTGQVGQEITLANPALLSERATGYEIGSQLTPARRLPATLRATWFWTEINRPVSAVFVSQTSTTITNQRENLGQIRSRGLELALDIRPVKRALSATLGYEFADSTVTRFSTQPALIGNRIPQVPAHSFTAQFRATTTRLGELTLAARAAGRAFDDANNQFPLAASSRSTSPATVTSTAASPSPSSSRTSPTAARKSPARPSSPSAAQSSPRPA